MIALVLLFACEGPVERGNRALQEDDLLRAEREFRAALDGDPTDAEALSGLGWTFHQAGEDGPARDAFLSLIASHPELPGGYRGVGNLLLSQGQLPGAREQLKKAVELAPEDPAANQSMALLELAEGKPADALARVEALLGADVDQGELQQTRAVALIRLERPAEARTAAQLAVNSAAGPRALAAARITWVQAVLTESDGRVDGDRCGETAGPVRAWLDAADHVLDQVEAEGALRSTELDMRKQVRRRRAFIEDECPSGAGGN